MKGIRLAVDGFSRRMPTRVCVGWPVGRYTRVWLGVLLCSCLAGTGAVYAQQPGAPLSSFAETQDDFDRFELFENCSPMHVGVSLHDDDDGTARYMNLTERRIRTTVESRLRAARLYDSDATSPLLRVSVHVVGQAFSIRVNLYKWVQDLASRKIAYAVTWVSVGTGTHGRDAGYIMQGVSEYMDKFINGYLRVNESACQ